MPPRSGLLSGLLKMAGTLLAPRHENIPAPDTHAGGLARQMQASFRLTLGRATPMAGRIAHGRVPPARHALVEGFSGGLPRQRTGAAVARWRAPRPARQLHAASGTEQGTPYARQRLHQPKGRLGKPHGRVPPGQRTRTGLHRPRRGRLPRIGDVGGSLPIGGGSLLVRDRICACRPHLGGHGDGHRWRAKAVGAGQCGPLAMARRDPDASQRQSHPTFDKINGTHPPEFTQPRPFLERKPVHRRAQRPIAAAPRLHHRYIVHGECHRPTRCRPRSRPNRCNRSAGSRSRCRARASRTSARRNVSCVTGAGPCINIAYSCVF